ncbi:sorting nexin-29 isoform X2 [Electrophorus electricus]|uniref:sorting nexin-29 isoform X2 n=1 Tax=Electrophorus electricus TaxID=8005 RepID=UPI0015D054DD|nr:sorting nexin-29 isoform X2 [Electrophorus electricus]
MNGTQQNDVKRQHLLERLLDAVKQCQIRFGGRKEIASDSDSRVICLCAQFEAVLHHGLRKSRGLALTAAAIKQAAGFTCKTEAELTFWCYVKEHLNRHELQRFYSLCRISSELGRGRAWLRCALNEHSLERSLHTLLADRPRLSAFYEEWAFILDEERASMLPTMAAGLNSILFAINIDNADLNGQVRAGPSVSHLLKGSTQGMSSLWKESAQGVSTLLREIGTATGGVPGFAPRPDCPSDPLPVLPRSTFADAGLRKERRRKKKITNIISFDDDLDVGVEDEEESADGAGGAARKSVAARESTEGAMEQAGPPATHNGLPEAEHGIVSWAETPPQNGLFPDTKSVDNDEDDDEDFYGKCQPELQEEPQSGEQVVVGSLSSVSTWSPRQIIKETDNDSSDMLIPVTASEPISQQRLSSTPCQPALTPSSPSVASSVEMLGLHRHTQSSGPPADSENLKAQTQFSMEPSASLQDASVSSMLVTVGLPDSMTVVELRQAILAMMNRKDELTEQNTSLRSLLDGEMEHSAGLRLELDGLRTKLAELEERHAARVHALGRENEVLKVQLKKYVGAVQMLKREGSQGMDLLPTLRSCDASVLPAPNRSVADVEELAASYERKLIEVAEMHGELIEFNERLYRSLMAKDILIGQMRQELIDLRGPVPGDLSQTSDDPSLSDFEIAQRALINVWIPSVFLQGRAANAYHVYQDAKFVEERRKQLQGYLRMVMNKLIQTLPEFTAQPSKDTLLQLLPFCQDTPSANDGGTKTARPKSSARHSRLGRGSGREARNPEPQSGDL